MSVSKSFSVYRDIFQVEFDVTGYFFYNPFGKQEKRKVRIFLGIDYVNV